MLDYRLSVLSLVALTDVGTPPHHPQSASPPMTKEENENRRYFLQWKPLDKQNPK